MARHALEAFAELAATKTAVGTRRVLREQSRVQEHVALAEAEHRAASRYFYGAVGDAWAVVEDGGEPTAAQRADVRLAIAHAVRASVAVVDRLYELAGGSAIYAQHPLERCFRDLHTAAAHILVGSQAYIAAGRVALGLPAGAPYF